MKEVIDLYRRVVIQIATPYITGTGFYLKDYGLVVTNEHIVRDNRQVIVQGEMVEKQLSRVLYVDQTYDLAFLELPGADRLPAVTLGADREIHQGDAVIAVGHPFGLKYSATQGIISNTVQKSGNVNYYQHDAALNPGNSGGPLINRDGAVVGVNTFIIQSGNNIGFSLPVHYLHDTLEEYSRGERCVAVRCTSCTNLVYEGNHQTKYCPHCGAHVRLPSQSEPYEPVGVAKTMEALLDELGFPAELSRRGPNNWELVRGSARISISYYEKNGQITGEAYLCVLPKNNIKPLYEYLLHQNYEMEGLNFSINGQDIILSLLIYDRYFNLDTGMALFRHLLERADYYDNILVEQYGARWKYEEEA